MPLIPANYEIVMISNSVPDIKQGRAGGLDSVLKDSMERVGGLWFGWNKSFTGTRSHQTNNNVEYVTFPHSETHGPSFKNVVADAFLWPMMHMLKGRMPTYLAPVAMKSYDTINDEVADNVIAGLREIPAPSGKKRLLWVHDYHHISLGAKLKEKGVEHSIAFFLHIPFPGKQAFQKLDPDCRQSVAQLFEKLITGYDLLGFQTADDEKKFKRFAKAMGAEITDKGVTYTQQNDGKTTTYRVATGAFPVGIDIKPFREFDLSSKRDSAIDKILEGVGDRDFFLGVDRLDPSKNVQGRLLAYEKWLEANPTRRHTSCFVQISPTSRDEVEMYRSNAEAVETIAARINRRFPSDKGPSVILHREQVDRQQLPHLFGRARVVVITSEADGHCVVGDEAIATWKNENPGVLVLSKGAGLYHQVKYSVVGVDPLNIANIAQGYEIAWNASLVQRKEWHTKALGAISRNTATDFFQNFVNAFIEVANRNNVHALLDALPKRPGPSLAPPLRIAK